MRIYAKIYSIIAVALGAFNACSLIHDDPEDCQLYTSEGVPYAYVAVAFNTGMNTSTRSNPTGGEDGDDLEPGQSNENQVNDITLFFYEVREGDKGVNSDSETKIVARHHFTKENFDAIPSNNHQIATTKPVEVTELLVNHSYHVLAVVNGGENFGKDVNTLGDLQQMKVTSIYKTSGSNPTQAGYTNFLMASADDEKPSLVILPSNSENRPAQTVIDVERVSARVDYRAQGSEGQKDGVYEVSSAPGLNPVEGKAKITGAMLMNVLDDEAPSWLLKRVADSWENPVVEYLGKEKAQENGAASNYVIDAIQPKGENNFMQDTYFKNFSYENLAWESQFKDPFFTLEDGYNCIGYPKENVNQQGDKALTTGVVFRAQYTPNDMEVGQTFFEYNGEEYATLNDLMQGFNENNWNNYIANNTNVWWPDVVTWNDLQTYIINQLREDPVGYRAFLASEYAKIEAASLSNEISEDDKTRLLWDNYLKSECKYIVDDKGVVVDSGDGTVSGTTRRILHETSDGQIRTFKEGICYYTYWIKHANDQNKENDLVGSKDKTGGVMEYAIVRNNVYKLNVTSISGPGGDIPGDRNVNVNVLVEDWQVISPGEDIELKPVTASGQN